MNMTICCVAEIAFDKYLELLFILGYIIYIHILEKINVYSEMIILFVNICWCKSVDQTKFSINGG